MRHRLYAYSPLIYTIHANRHLSLFWREGWNLYNTLYLVGLKFILVVSFCFYDTPFDLQIEDCCYKLIDFSWASVHLSDMGVIQSLISCWNLVSVPISDKTSYCKISWSLEAARFVFRIVWLPWKLTGTSEGLLPTCLYNFKAMRWSTQPNSRLRVTRSQNKTFLPVIETGSCIWLPSALIIVYMGCIQFGPINWGLFQAQYHLCLIFVVIGYDKVSVLF